MRTLVKKISEFLRKEFYRSKNRLKWVLSRGVCDKTKAQTAQFRAMGIVSGPSRHPKDVPFVSDFWCERYGLGAISPRKKTNFGEISNFEFTKLHISTSLARGRHALLRTTLRALLLASGTESRSRPIVRILRYQKTRSRHIKCANNIPPT